MTEWDAFDKAVDSMTLSHDDGSTTRAMAGQYHKEGAASSAQPADSMTMTHDDGSSTRAMAGQYYPEPKKSPKSPAPSSADAAAQQSLAAQASVGAAYQAVAHAAGQNMHNVDPVGYKALLQEHRGAVEKVQKWERIKSNRLAREAAGVGDTAIPAPPDPVNPAAVTTATNPKTMKPAGGDLVYASSGHSYKGQQLGLQKASAADLLNIAPTQQAADTLAQFGTGIVDKMHAATKVDNKGWGYEDDEMLKDMRAELQREIDEVIGNLKAAGISHKEATRFFDLKQEQRQELIAQTFKLLEKKQKLYHEKSPALTPTVKKFYALKDADRRIEDLGIDIIRGRRTPSRSYPGIPTGMPLESPVMTTTTTGHSYKGQSLGLQKATAADLLTSQDGYLPFHDEFLIPDSEKTLKQQGLPQPPGFDEYGNPADGPNDYGDDSNRTNPPQRDLPEGSIPISTFNKQISYSKEGGGALNQQQMTPDQVQQMMVEARPGYGPARLSAREKRLQREAASKEGAEADAPISTGTKPDDLGTGKYGHQTKQQYEAMMGEAGTKALQKEVERQLAAAGAPVKQPLAPTQQGGTQRPDPISIAFGGGTLGAIKGQLTSHLAGLEGVRQRIISGTTYLPLSTASQVGRDPTITSEIIRTGLRGGQTSYHQPPKNMNIRTDIPPKKSQQREIDRREAVKAGGSRRLIDAQHEAYRQAIQSLMETGQYRNRAAASAALGQPKEWASQFPGMEEFYRTGRLQNAIAAVNPFPGGGTLENAQAWWSLLSGSSGYGLGISAIRGMFQDPLAPRTTKPYSFLSEPNWRGRLTRAIGTAMTAINSRLPPDKQDHAAVGRAISLATYHGLVQTGMPEKQAFLIAMGTAGGAGIGKEFLDTGIASSTGLPFTGGGNVEFMDFLATFMGGVGALGPASTTKTPKKSAFGGGNKTTGSGPSPDNRGGGAPEGYVWTGRTMNGRPVYYPKSGTGKPIYGK